MEEKNIKELETTVSGKNESSQPDKITSKQYLQAYCRFSYRMRKLKTKGAILILLWSFMVMGVFNYYTLHCLFHEKSNSLMNDIIDYRWFILVEFLFAASGTMLAIGTIEFLCAKIIPIAMIAFTIVLSIKYHKKRKREDVLPSEHIFAEQYYSAE